MSKYTITLAVTVEMEIEPEVISRTQTEEWQNHFWRLTEREALEMLAWNVGVREIGLSRLDGWADLPDTAAVVTDLDYEVEDVAVQP